MLELANHQLDALKVMKNGCILCGDVGSGKSRTALAYYYICACRGSLKINGTGKYEPMRFPKDLYIITTAQKRDKKEWEEELWEFIVPDDVKVTIDSWNNIKKYKEVYGAFFIFDEQRVIGSGVWVKAFLNISRKNQWILLSATPGDKWTDYIPVFVANGFYRNKTEFQRRHVIYDPYVTKYPKIRGYINEGELVKHRRDILVKMKDQRHTVRHDYTVPVNYNRELYRTVWKDRWNPFDNEPIEETGKLCYLLRRCVNSDPSRVNELIQIMCKHDRIIIFYNHNYELDILRDLMIQMEINFGEYNGHKHDPIPKSVKWTYLVQYTAGAEGWNCIESDCMVFFSATYSYRSMVQAKGRIDRMNTPFTDLHYYVFYSNAPIDRAIHTAVTRGKDFNERDFLNSGGKIEKFRSQLEKRQNRKPGGQ